MLKLKVFIALALIGVWGLVGCSGDSEVPTGPSPTSPSISTAVTPTAVARPTVVATPTATVSVEAASPTISAMTVQEYAQTCGALLNPEWKTGKEGEEQFASMVKELRSVVPPPELAEIHEAITEVQSSQIAATIGPNAETQAASVRQFELTAAMPDEHRVILTEQGCLNAIVVQMGQMYLAARDRIAARGPSPSPATVEDYAARCADVRMTTPLMDSRDNIGWHLILKLDELTPPQELEQFHDHMIATLRTWLLGNGTESVGAAMREATSLARDGSSVSTENYNALVSSGCIFP